MLSDFSVDPNDLEHLQLNVTGQIDPYNIYIKIVYSRKNHFPSRGNEMTKNNTEIFILLYSALLLRTSTPNFTCRKTYLKFKGK